jgi:hypothetical protein
MEAWHLTARAGRGVLRHFPQRPNSGWFQNEQGLFTVDQGHEMEGV